MAGLAIAKYRLRRVPIQRRKIVFYRNNAGINFRNTPIK